MEKITYYFVDNNPNVIRLRGCFWEKYVKSVGWVEDTYYVGIYTGDIPFYERVAEEEAMKRVEKIERS